MHEFNDLPLQGSTLDFLVFPENLDLLHHPHDWSLKEAFNTVFNKVVSYNVLKLSTVGFFNSPR